MFYTLEGSAEIISPLDNQSQIREFVKGVGGGGYKRVGSV